MNACEYCGQSYDPDVKGAGPRFCSQRCVTIWANKKRLGSKVLPRDWPCEKCGRIVKATAAKRVVCNLCKQAVCVYCQRKFTPPSAAKAKIRKYCSLNCWAKHLYERRGKPSGADHWNWKGDAAVSAEGWRGTGWSRIREAIRERDNYTCQECGVRPEPLTVTNYNSKRGATYVYQKWPLTVHHVDGFERNEPEHHAEFNDPDKLITLCLSCHTSHHRTHTH